MSTNVIDESPDALAMERARLTAASEISGLPTGHHGDRLASRQRVRDMLAEIAIREEELKDIDEHIAGLQREEANFVASLDPIQDTKTRGPLVNMLADVRERIAKAKRRRAEVQATVIHKQAVQNKLGQIGYANPDLLARQYGLRRAEFWLKQFADESNQLIEKLESSIDSANRRAESRDKKPPTLSPETEQSLLNYRAAAYAANTLLADIHREKSDLHQSMIDE